MINEKCSLSTGSWKLGTVMNYYDRDPEQYTYANLLKGNYYNKECDRTCK